MIYWLTSKNNYKISKIFIEIFKALPSSSQPPLLLVCFSPPPSEEHLRGEFGLFLLKREADVGPRVLREHRLSLSHLLCESAGCFMHPRVVWPMERCDAEGCDPFFLFIYLFKIQFWSIFLISMNLLHELISWHLWSLTEYKDEEQTENENILRFSVQKHWFISQKN